MFDDVYAADLSTPHIRKMCYHLPDAVVLFCVYRRRSRAWSPGTTALESWWSFLANLRSALPTFHYSRQFACQLYGGHHHFWYLFCHRVYLVFGNHIFALLKIATIVRKSTFRLTFRIPRAALQSIRSRWAPMEQGVSAIPFCLYRDHGLTKTRNTHTLRGLHFSGNTSFLSLKAKGFWIFGSRQWLFAIVAIDRHCRCVD